MGFYEDGTEMGLVEYGPGDVSRQMGEVNTFLSAVNKDMETDVKKTGNAGFLTKWRQDVWGPWQGFYSDFRNVLKGSPSRFRDSTYKRAEAFRQLGVNYRENLSKKFDSQVTPVKVPDPIKVPPKQAPPGRPIDIDLPPAELRRGFPWRYVVIGGVAVVVGYGVYRYYKPALKVLPLPVGKDEHGQPQ